MSAGLEVEPARQDRLVLHSLPGVIAVKGTGAGLADSVWVILSETTSAEEKKTVIQTARDRGLSPIALKPFYPTQIEPGVQNETFKANHGH